MTDANIATLQEGEPSPSDLESAREVLLRSVIDAEDCRSALLTIRIVALTTPQLIDRPTVAACEQILQRPDVPVGVAGLTTRVLLALLYAAPDLIGPGAVTGARAILNSSALPARTYRQANALLRFLLIYPPGSDAMDLVYELFRRPELPPERFDGLIETLQYAARWRMDLLSFEKVLPIVGSGNAWLDRDVLLHSILERLLFAAPEEITVSALHRVLALYEETPELKYFLYYLAGRPAAPTDARRIAAERIQGLFPLHELIRRDLGEGRKRILVIRNMYWGQGDEIYMTVPLVESLLAFNPLLEIVLLSTRSYLYDNRRLTVVPIQDSTRSRAVLSEEYDGLINVLVDNPFDAALDRHIEASVRAYQPALNVAALPEPWVNLVYDRVEVGGVPWSQALGLDVPRTENVYESTLRLIAELGLPLRAGEESPEPNSVLVGRPCREAEELWRELLEPNTQGERRPVAVVNPFGGADPRKGFMEQHSDLLAAQLRGLIREGYYLVVLPNGRPWGTEALARRVVRLLEPADRAQVTVAPDPGAKGGWIRSYDARTEPLPYASFVMRLFKYLASYADLVVTVEGWLMHMAYCLGKPCRIFMTAFSGSLRYPPHGRARRQEAVWRFSPCVEYRYSDRSGSPMLLPKHRQELFIQVLRQVAGGSPDARILPFVRSALTSPDFKIRGAAARILVTLRDPRHDADLIPLLDDPASNVRSFVATALRERLESSREPWPVPREHLLALEAMKPGTTDWEVVAGLGEAARAALERALTDEVPGMRGHAMKLLARLEPPQ